MELELVKDIQLKNDIQGSIIDWKAEKELATKERNIELFNKACEALRVLRLALLGVEAPLVRTIDGVIDMGEKKKEIKQSPEGFQTFEDFEDQLPDGEDEGGD